MILQRQDELEAKYGLAFTIIDRFYNRKAVVKPHVWASATDPFWPLSFSAGNGSSCPRLCENS
jgi:hypothetical protein